MITASVEGEAANETCQLRATRYSDAKATSGGATVCTTTITAISMLRLMSTGSVIARVLPVHRLREATVADAQGCN